jgi:small subunit ribosomal protein S20
MFRDGREIERRDPVLPLAGVRTGGNGRKGSGGKAWKALISNGFGPQPTRGRINFYHFPDFNPFKFGSSSAWAYLCRPKNVEFMANHKATKKDVRQATKRRDRNRYYGKTTRNAIRDLRELKVQKEAGEKLPEVASMIDKLAKKGIIHKNKAANLKSKLARKVNALATAAAAPAAKAAK